MKTCMCIVLPTLIIVHVICVYFVRSVSGHARLIEPPSRASAWRFGFATPPNYEDNELNCGGLARQRRNRGKCGVCGDPWDSMSPRRHEYGGQFGQGVVVRRYAPGSVVTLMVDVTDYHKGFFTFRLCPDFQRTTQRCLNQMKLMLAEPQFAMQGPTHKYYPLEGNKVYMVRYRLPNIYCPHCVLQMRYKCGNNWGYCRDGTGRLGCGPQEEFRACADVAIY